MRTDLTLIGLIVLMIYVAYAGWERVAYLLTMALA
jgi:hypothetical protein